MSGNHWSTERLLRCVLITFIFATFLTTGCAGSRSAENDDDYAIDTDVDEQMLYDAAQSSLLAGNFVDAIQQLERLESYFPFGRFAEQAQLELIYANFMRNDYDTAIIAAERFINLHPQHQNVDYAYYMKGLSSFQRDRGVLDVLLGTPEALRDVSGAKEAFIFFDEFLKRFPDSTYSKDAQLRMYSLRNVLAESELAIAVFYMRREAWLSALNRAREIVEHYPTTVVTPFALVVMIEANHRLGLNDARDDALRVLTLNFPDYPGFNDDGELVIGSRVRNKDRSVLNVLSFGLLDQPKSQNEIRLPPISVEKE